MNEGIALTKCLFPYTIFGILILKLDKLLVRYPLDNNCMTLRTDNLLVRYPLTDNDSIIYDDIDLREIFEMYSFEIYGKWSVQASQQA